jgi:hypothetical protein
MRQKFFAFMVLLYFPICQINGQESASLPPKPLIELSLLSTEGISAEESKLIGSLVESYLSEMGELIVRSEPESDNFPVQDGLLRRRDYLISGSISVEGESRIFMLEISDTNSGESYSFNSVYKSAGELALKARSLLESAFADIIKPEQEPLARAESISENQIIGTWKGEPGTEMVRLRRGGRGVVIYSSGIIMTISYKIEGNVLRIWQASPNSERFFFFFPQSVARQLAAKAEPMFWELFLDKKGAALEGSKKSAAARIENGKVVEILPAGDMRKVLWTRVVF